jgi:hypothetical protein
MRLPRGREVPITAGVSGVVFVLGLINFDGSHMYRNETLLFAVWGTLYLIESIVRSRRPVAPVSGTPRADPRRAQPPADRSPDAIGGART